MVELERIAEQRIREAMARGEFDDLPGRGRPVNLDDDALVPEEMRVAYRVLKNAGYLPEELELRRDIAATEALLGELVDGQARRSAIKRLGLLQARLASRGGSCPLNLEGLYRERLVDRLARTT